MRPEGRSSRSGDGKPSEWVRVGLGIARKANSADKSKLLNPQSCIQPPTKIRSLGVQRRDLARQTSPIGFEVGEYATRIRYVPCFNLEGSFSPGHMDWQQGRPPTCCTILATSPSPTCTRKRSINNSPFYSSSIQHSPFLPSPPSSIRAHSPSASLFLASALPPHFPAPVSSSTLYCAQLSMLPFHFSAQGSSVEVACPQVWRCQVRRHMLGSEA